MKLAIIDKEGKKTGDFNLDLSCDVREDIFKKAVVAERSFFRQEYGSFKGAGRRHTINVSKRRQKFRSTYGKGGSRTPKKTMWRRGMQLRFVGAFAPNTVGGRRAHPPKAEKIIFKNINNKEWLKALKIGLFSSLDNKIVLSNGQRVPSNYPFVLDNSLENISKTSDFRSFLDKLGFADEILRTSQIKVRAGKGKMRNRRFKVKRGPIVVVSSLDKSLMKSARNIKGFDVVSFDFLNVSDFAMSVKPGRAVIFTKSALEEFMEVFN